VTSVRAFAKINLALVVGPLRADGKHEVVTVLQHVDLADRITVTLGERLEVRGFEGDTIVTAAVRALADTAGVEPRYIVEIVKRIPVAAGLGGGSSDAAAALRTANEMLPTPLEAPRLEALAATIGADVPFFLRRGPQLGTGDGTTLAALALPRGYWVVLLLPDGVSKESTREVYAAFDARVGAVGFDGRRTALLGALREIRQPVDLVRLPANDLAASTHAQQFVELGAFRADVSGAGPCVYGLFETRTAADEAAEALGYLGRTWVTAPVAL
jgi:4-diphosphocytidyl-2-C-methyl-D-erythritol kinase